MAPADRLRRLSVAVVVTRARSRPADQPTLAGRPTEHDEARALLGQVMGFVAITVGFTALGAYLGRDLSGTTGLVLFIGAFACIAGLNIAAARRREQLAIGLLFGLGLLLGLAVAPVIADYADADPSALWQSAAGIFLDVFNTFFIGAKLFGGRR
jgi:modulator of FtsH protease